MFNSVEHPASQLQPAQSLRFSLRCCRLHLTAGLPALKGRGQGASRQCCYGEEEAEEQDGSWEHHLNSQLGSLRRQGSAQQTGRVSGLLPTCRCSVTASGRTANEPLFWAAPPHRSLHAMLHMHQPCVHHRSTMHSWTGCKCTQTNCGSPDCARAACMAVQGTAAKGRAAPGCPPAGAGPLHAGQPLRAALAPLQQLQLPPASPPATPQPGQGTLHGSRPRGAGWTVPSVGWRPPPAGSPLPTHGGACRRHPLGPSCAGGAAALAGGCGSGPPPPPAAPGPCRAGRGA